MKNRPPFLLHVVALAFVLLALVNFFGVLQAVQSWNWLVLSNYTPGPVYTVFKGVFLGLASLITAVFLWTRLHWSPLFAGTVIILTSLWHWFDRLFLAIQQPPLKAHLLPLILTVMFLFFGLFSLYVLEPYMKSPHAKPPKKNGEMHETVEH